MVTEQDVETTTEKTDSPDETRRLTYRRSPTLTKLAPALAKMMGAIGPAMKDTLNPHFGKKYVTLAGCHAVAIGPMRENGFSFPMFPSLDADRGLLTVTGLLLHESGEYLEGSITIPLKERDAQKVLAAETYARRGLYCMVGVVPDDDDDGESVVGRGQQAEPARKEAQRTPPAPPQKAPRDAFDKAKEIIGSLPKEAQTTFKSEAEVASRPASVPPDAIINDEPISNEMIDRVKKAYAAKGFGAKAAIEHRTKVTGKTEGLTMADGVKVLQALEAG